MVLPNVLPCLRSRNLQSINPEGPLPRDHGDYGLRNGTVVSAYRIHLLLGPHYYS
jgi:hypothetical protein